MDAPVEFRDAMVELVAGVPAGTAGLAMTGQVVISTAYAESQRAFGLLGIFTACDFLRWLVNN
eukprot:2944948-Karenia_brevis.AAC.1